MGESCNGGQVGVQLSTQTIRRGRQLYTGGKLRVCVDCYTEPVLLVESYIKGADTPQNDVEDTVVDNNAVLCLCPELSSCRRCISQPECEINITVNRYTACIGYNALVTHSLRYLSPA